MPVIQSCLHCFNLYINIKFVSFKGHNTQQNPYQNKGQVQEHNYTSYCRYITSTINYMYLAIFNDIYLPIQLSVIYDEIQAKKKDNLP